MMPLSAHHPKLSPASHLMSRDPCRMGCSCAILYMNRGQLYSLLDLCSFSQCAWKLSPQSPRHLPLKTASSMFFVHMKTMLGRAAVSCICKYWLKLLTKCCSKLTLFTLLSSSSMVGGSTCLDMRLQVSIAVCLFDKHLMLADAKHSYSRRLVS